MSLPESVTKTKQWPMWAGSATDLRRLLRLVEAQFESLIPSHLVSNSAHEHERLKYSVEQRAKVESDLAESPHLTEYFAQRVVDLDADIEERQETVRRVEEEAALAGRIDLTLTAPDDERRQVTGTATELVEYLDGREFQEMEFSAPSGYIRNHSITVRLDRSRGIQLRAASTDSRWCTAGYAEIHAEIARQVPRSRFVRTYWFLYSVYFVSAAVTVWFVADILLSPQSPSGSASVYWISCVLATFIAMGASALTQKLIPAVEVVASGKTSGMKALLAVLGTSVASVVLGVVGNALSNVILG